MKKFKLIRVVIFPFLPAIAYQMTLLLTPNAFDYLNLIYNVLFVISLWIAVYFLGELDD
ncbi:TPA: potassium transporter Trk [Streptococcus suis]|uniref:Membrane protein n=1 Tax=Streptococcus suis TaxID=1307 RepID=A0A116LVX9_STRSU|nr:membrane protein [Streptococcus suis]CYX76291.1 membrane protein [Streptococcus suis]HEM6134103.1 potassium transporter Trk [Streptococcus suis]HEM6158948.1 potassium transporter Trk [Streptococcus suis]HEM6361756.1 potassium transporter Trk [Streptococcus suis]